jgi:1-phosphatidylinositol phosphodiesterase
MKQQALIVASSLLLTVFTLQSCRKDALTYDRLEPVQAAAVDAVAQPLVAAVSLNSWMTAIPDNYSLAQLSIPGTHDAGARYEPVSGTAKCQNLTIAEQLNAGIRFLDIRCRHIGNAFAIHHGSVYQNLNFDDVLTACTNFLNSNPGESIIMSVREEYDPSNNTRSFEQTFDDYTQRYAGRWYLGATIPNLGQVRGKIVLIRRFGASSTPKGIDATNWADNTTFTISNANASLRVQDQYVVPDNNAKWNTISALLNEAKTLNPAVLYLNFTSGYKALIFNIPSITTVSNAINPKISTYFSANTSGRYGIVAMDFADAQKAQLIVTTNF